MVCCVPYVNIYDRDVSRARAGRVIVVSGSESKPKATDRWVKYRPGSRRLGSLDRAEKEVEDTDTI